MKSFNHRRQHAIALGIGLILTLYGMPALAQGDFAPASSDPENLFLAGEYLCFVADDGLRGRELWATAGDKGSARLVLDITPGPVSTEISHPVSMDGFALFRVVPHAGAGQLWRTDGTAEGTHVVHTFEGNGDERYVAPLGRAGGFLYLCVKGPAGELYLWRSDGTAEGTVRVVLPDHPIRELSISQGSSATIGDVLLFGAALFVDGVNETPSGLWRTDGTPEGTYELHRFFESPSNFSSIRGRAYFRANDGHLGHEPWISDGTPEGTRPIADLEPGPGSSAPGDFAYTHSGVAFSAGTESGGRELWLTDGTAEGTRLAELTPGLPDSDPYKLTTLAEEFVCFVAAGDAHGREIWRNTDTPLGGIMLHDICPGPCDSSPYAFAVFYDRLYFSAHAPDTGEELWVTDGTAEGTRMLMDIAPGPMNSSPYGTIAYKDCIYFAASHPLYGRELWRAPGIHERAELFADVNRDDSVNPSSTPAYLTPAGNYLYFVADDIRHGAELWRTDGTEPGTALVRDIFPGRTGSDPRDLTAVGKTVYFVADDGTHGVELWISDGTEGGTAIAADIQYPGGSAPKELTEFNGRLIFVATRESDGEELWIAKGRELVRVRDIAIGPASSSPRDLAVWNGLVYFRADDAVHGEELWRSDGSERGTFMVKDIVPVPFEGAAVENIGPFKDRLVFTADDRVHGCEVWQLRSDAGSPRPIDVSTLAAHVRAKATP